MERFLTQILNMVFRKFLNRGINAGIDHLSRRGKPPAEMTPAERQQAQQARDLAKRARQAARLTRRLGR
ncbi:MAG: hypothetical protein KBF78_02835 [Fuscovulum sp.]|jgi:hypothetical protein|nr:hypothetical protein [Fuscovulum sp.]